MRYFVAVAEELSFRRAAGRLRLAQPSLSKQIKDLEYEMGVKLLERNTAGVALTDAGRYFLDEARDILERVQMAVTGAQEAQAGRTGTLTIANVSAISANFLPAALAAFRELYPEVEVNVEEMFLPDQVDALMAGRAHVGFLIDSGEELEDVIDRFKVYEGVVGVAMGRDHPLARHAKVSIHDLARERLLSISVGRHNLHRKRIEAIFARRCVRHGAIKAVSSFESLLAMIEGNHGVSILAPAGGNRRGDQVVFRPLKEAGDDLRIDLFAIWRKHGATPLAINFVEVLRGTSMGRSAVRH